ncbi:SDR family oxidoreductase [Alphaproteobacteria bacterium GH1-50]|uniref:SDR family oxidoreductase n=1 Tax=Kangsaoukella pontilimi TaxID=2691042 RepID=A0A7C9N2F4_9RHOB|nr:SDR family oxidoreductase [Kangsaoukella pontilimi]MXQ09338.1 SDR family oxidoreductase [Kangsaoukella pontilimi]
MAHRVLVTGGAGGLGARISKLLSDRGAAVAIGYGRGRDRATALAEQLRQAGGSAVAVRIDVSDPQSVTSGVDEAARALGGLSALVNSAGTASAGASIPDGDLEALSPEIWDGLMAVNHRGPYLTARAALPFLRASGQGRIVNIGSTIGHGVWGAGAVYAPSKGALLSLTRFLAARLAPDITVNLVSPGLMLGSDMSSRAPAAYIDGWKHRSALERTTDPDDVARAVITFLDSPSVTGQSLIVDGGIHFE